MRATQNMGFGTHDPLGVPRPETCSKCGQEVQPAWHSTAVEYARTGMFDDLPLYRFEVEGQTYEEVVQHEEWWSGPMLFLAYRRVGDGRLFNTWTRAEIRRMTR